MILKFSYLRELRRLHSEPSSPSSSTYAPKKPYAKKDWKNKGTVMTTILPDELPIPTSPNLIGYDQSYDSWETYANLRDSDHDCDLSFHIRMFFCYLLFRHLSGEPNHTSS